MKKTSAPQEAKSFKFHFTPLMIALACATYALCALGIAMSIWRIVNVGIYEFTDMLESPLLILICVFGIVILTAMLVRSRYLVTKEHFITQFGFIKSKFPIQDLTSILLDTDSHKLTVYMGEQYFVVTTAPEWNNDLVQAIREVNPNVEFSFTLAEKKDKK